MIKLFNVEALRFLNRHKGGMVERYDMVFMDPPDNIGLNYGCGEGYDIDDKKPTSEYFGWLRNLILNSMNRSDIVWISYYWKHLFEVSSIIRALIGGTSWNARTFIWRFGFGQYRESDCPNGFRPIIRLSRGVGKWNFPNEVRVQSERARLGDPRSVNRLRVPDDVWDFSRIQGNNLERRKWCPTQHPEALVNRIVRMSLPLDRRILGPGGDFKILELFTGSGTTIRVVKRLEIETPNVINLDTVELNTRYCELLRQEHPEVEVA